MRRPARAAVPRWCLTAAGLILLTEAFLTQLFTDLPAPLLAVALSSCSPSAPPTAATSPSSDGCPAPPVRRRRSAPAHGRHRRPRSHAPTPAACRRPDLTSSYRLGIAVLDTLDKLREELAGKDIALHLARPRTGTGPTGPDPARPGGQRWTVRPPPHRRRRGLGGDRRTGLTSTPGRPFSG
ncbi:hypothetical protein ACIQRW_30475 [Streptomyces sp. NPDC091287]|uniref:hypothetical protein n=1 Tax=Streptomyces sp. NPDC091287 TaxID=3365988 RepID=UPI00382A02F6